VGDLRFPDTLPEKLTKLVEYYQRSFPLEVNLNHEIEAYKAFAHKLQVRRRVRRVCGGYRMELTDDDTARHDTHDTTRSR